MADRSITGKLREIQGLRNPQMLRDGLLIAALTIVSKRASMPRWSKTKVRDRLATILHLFPLTPSKVRYLANGTAQSLRDRIRMLMVRDKVLEQGDDGRYKINTFVFVYQI